MGSAARPSTVRAMRRALLAWYGPRRAAYPWRRPHPDPYAVLVSEVMLQQTQAARVAPAFERFLARFPSVADLAAASRADVVRAWDGLGHNRRAVSLSEAARRIAREHGGRVPSDPVALERLPGVGPYTAAAVASLAYGVPVVAVDVNVRRVVARAVLGADAAQVPPGALREAASLLLDPVDPGGANQALMDLGRERCRPVPRCAGCPLARWCPHAAAGGAPAQVSPRPSRFEGSSRQLRGRVVAALRRGAALGTEALATEVGQPVERVAAAVRSLAADGLVEVAGADPGGRMGGKVRLSEG